MGMAAVLTLGSMGLSGGYVTANASGLPTTDGHNKYVNSEVFSVIGSSDFGSKPLESPLFDKTTGKQDISNLQVPTLAYDESSIGLVWSKPEKYDNVADYNVYIGGVKAGTARENFKVNAEWTAKYMEAFYDYYETASDVEMVNVDIHSYRATDLQPDTEYTFKVVAVDGSGKELGTAKTVTQKTTAKAEVVNVTDFGAKTIAQWNAEHADKSTGSDSQGFVDYDEEKDAFVVANTEAIQEAINKCPENGKVVIPEGTFMSGAVWLKSNMTLEVNGTLWASANSDHFEIGFLMYPFYTDTRGWGLVNAMTADESNPLTNIRVTGNGTLYGNGWKYGIKDSINGDGYTSNAGSATKMDGDPSDSKYALPRYVAGNNTKVLKYGIQSMDSVVKYLKNVTDDNGVKKYEDTKIDSLIGGTTAPGIDTNDLKNAYATRSSLLIMRNCENVYIGDFTIENPSNHSVNILDSRNIAANNVKVFSFDGNNGDGLGFGCSQNVICWNNFTDTGDDNLGFGASVGEGARDAEIQANSEIWMFNNFLREGHGGLAAGSHTGNGIQDVLFEDTVMNHIDMAFRFKSAPTNGGFGANITMRDCAVADTQQGYVLTTSYSDANSASTTEYAEIGEFYNFASYNVSMSKIQYNTIQVLADIDPVANPQKPMHSHHNLYFQDITFGNVGTNGSYKNKNGWETLIGCENAVFYNFKTVSYNSASKSKNTNKTWNNLQYCKNIQFQGTTWDSVNTCTDKMTKVQTGLNVTDANVSAVQGTKEAAVAQTLSGSTTVGATIAEWTPAQIVSAQDTADRGLEVIWENKVDGSQTGTAGKWKTGSDSTDASGYGTAFVTAAGEKAYESTYVDGSTGETKITGSAGSVPKGGSYIKYTAAQDGYLCYVAKTMAKKATYAVDEDAAILSEVRIADGENTDYSLVKIPVVSGKTYYIYADGASCTIYKMYLAEAVAASTPAEPGVVADPSCANISWTSTVTGNEGDVFYGVDTYVGENKVDTVDGIQDTKTTINRLSAGVTYTFKVYVSEKGDNANSMSLTGINKTYVGSATLVMPGTDTTEITAPATAAASTSDPFYTHALGSWTNISKSDARVRGYQIYVNGNLKKTIYNYQIKDYKTEETIGQQIGRLTPGVENAIRIVAFTDAGIEYSMDTTATTLENYDYKAPVFVAGAELTAEKQENGDVVLTWPAATDDTAVGGYRVYVDGEAVVPAGQRDFNPVNGAKTTTETTYTVTGLDLSKDHTFTVQAGDSWWKANTPMGTFDKMAGFNWTNKGLSTELKVFVSADYTAVDAAIAAANKLNAADYVDFTAVTTAINAIDRTLSTADQAKVDAMEKAINDAVAALEKKPATTDPAEPSKPTESTEVQVPVQKAEDVAVEVKDSAIESDAKVVTATGEEVSVKDVQLKVEKASEDKIEDIKEALAKKDIQVSEAKEIVYLDLSLATAAGDVVKLESGKVKVTLAYKEDIDLSKYEVVVYHLKDNGEVEILSVTAGTESFSFETEGFSPFAVAYVEKKAETPAEDTSVTPSTDAEQADDSTPTGDTNRIFTYVLLLAAAMLAAGVVFLEKKRMHK